MSREEAIKAHDALYDAKLRVRRAEIALTKARALVETCRVEYNAATDAANQADTAAMQAMTRAISEEVKEAAPIEETKESVRV